MTKMFCTTPTPEWFLPIDGIFVTNNGHTCDVHHIGCSIVLLLVRILHGFGVMLQLLAMATDDLVACFDLNNGRAQL